MHVNQRLHNSWRLGLEMLLTGKETVIDANIAYQKGFINHVAEDYEDMREGIQAFLNKTTPQWQDK